MSKDAFIAAHEELTDQMMEATGCTWEEAYEATGDAAYDHMRDRLADLADMARNRAKEF